MVHKAIKRTYDSMDLGKSLSSVGEGVTKTLKSVGNAFIMRKK